MSSFCIIAESVSRLKKAFAAIAVLSVDLFNLDVMEDKLAVQTMDASHICLVEMKLPLTYFTSYALSRPCRIGLKMDNVKSTLDCVTEGTPVTLTYDGIKKPDSLKISWNEKSYVTLNLMNIEDNKMEPPDADLDLTLWIPATTLKDGVAKCGKFGDSVTITADAVDFEFYARGDMGELTHSCSKEVQKQEGGVSKGIYAQKHMAQITNIKAVDEFAKMEFYSKDDDGQRVSLLSVRYYIHDVAEISYFLASKIEPDS